MVDVLLSEGDGFGSFLSDSTPLSSNKLSERFLEEDHFIYDTSHAFNPQHMFTDQAAVHSMQMVYESQINGFQSDILKYKSIVMDLEATIRKYQKHYDRRHELFGWKMVALFAVSVVLSFFLLSFKLFGGLITALACYSIFHYSLSSPSPTFRIQNKHTPFIVVTGILLSVVLLFV